MKTLSTRRWPWKEGPSPDTVKLSKVPLTALLPWTPGSWQPRPAVLADRVRLEAELSDGEAGLSDPEEDAGVAEDDDAVGQQRAADEQPPPLAAQGARP